MSFAEAASIPVVFVTAYHCIWGTGPVRKGERVTNHYYIIFMFLLFPRFALVTERSNRAEVNDLSSSLFHDDNFHIMAKCIFIVD